MNKKVYEAPVVKKVRLAIKNAVLSSCSTSAANTPGGVGNCYFPFQECLETP